jgi:hypothetical protein
MNHLLRRYEEAYVVFPPLGEDPRLLEALQEGPRGWLEPLLELARAHRFPV